MVSDSFASGLANHSPECKMSVNQNQSLWNRTPHSLASGLSGTEPTPFQDGTFNTLEIAGITTGLLEDQTVDPHFLPYACSQTNTLALAPGATLPVSSP